MKCLCPQCTPEPAETYTEEYRHLKEVEYVSQQSAEWIKAYLEGVEKQRGLAARIKLRSDVAKKWRNK